MKIRFPLALATVAGLCQIAGAQTSVTLRLDRVEDFFGLLNQAEANPFFVGTALSAIETDGSPNNWFVAGILGGSSNQPWTVSIVKVEFDFSVDPPTRSFRAIPTSRLTNIAPFSAQGFTAMDYLPGRGLIASYDDNNDFSSHYQVYDVDTQLNPILTAEGAVHGGFRYGSGGCAWDNGPTGTGFNYSYDVTDPDSGLTISVNTSGALPLGLVFGDLGPRTSIPEQLNFVASHEVGPGSPPAGLRFFAGNGGGASGAIAGSPKLIPVAGNSLWRAIDVHPSTGVMVARANNSLIMASRQSDNSTLDTNLARINFANGTNQTPNALGQRCKVLNGAPGGDLVVFNSRPITSAGQAFTSSVKFRQLPAVIDSLNPPAEVVANFIDSTGAPLALPAGVGMYDFAWIACSNQLLVLDADTSATGRKVYVFSVNPASPGAPVQSCDAAPSCPVDFNNDGILSPDDLDEFITTYFTEPPDNAAADFNNDGIVSPDDLDEYITAYFEGC